MYTESLVFNKQGPDKEFAEELLSYTDTFYKTVVSSFKGDVTEAGNMTLAFMVLMLFCYVRI